MPALTDQAIAEIARPLKQPAAIVRYFQQVLHIRAERRPDGSVLVLEEWLRDTDHPRKEPRMNL